MAVSNDDFRTTSRETARPGLPGPPAARRLIVFSRYPEPGTTKTRLIGRLGAAGAAELQRELTAHTLASASALRASVGVDVEVRYDGGSGAAMRDCFGDGVSYRPQGDGDLGERMARSIADAFEEGVAQAVLIGSDCPGVTPELLGRAFGVLTEDPDGVVVGPALDGGYYLIGVSRPLPELFRGIDWGTDRVFAQTRAAAFMAGDTFRALEPLADVDRPEDLAVWHAVRCGPAGSVPNPRISVVIPALNEEKAVALAVDSALAAEPVEVIVVDGGSRDGTAAVARSHGAEVVAGRRGRAAQMNAGAARAVGDVLVFLHADTVLPAGYDRAVGRTLARPGTAAGAFRLSIGGRGRSYRVIEALVGWRSAALGLPYGDQALFMTADVFRRAGGYPDLPIMEDLELTRRLRRFGRIRLTPERVVTSARRWHEGGVWRTTLVNQVCLGAYFAGAPVGRIAAWRGGHSERPDGAEAGRRHG